MTSRLQRTSRLFVGIALAVLAVLACVLAAPAPRAYAVTAAEKQAEADAVWAQIDSLQTSLNEANARYEEAVEARDQAIAERDAAAAAIEEQNARIERLQAELSSFAVAMYKNGGTNTFIEVLLGTATFEDFLTSLDAVSDISKAGGNLLREAREAREMAEQARKTYEEQSVIAEQQMKEAEESRIQIEQTQEALREQAEQISAEAAELQAEEELAAERARQAEEARRLREEALAAAYDAAATSDYAPGDSVLMGSGYFTNPCPDAYNSSGFGYRTFDNSFHKGLDMAAASGTPYYAADRGTVIYATNDGGWNGGAGNWVVIAHGNGIVTKYMHSLETFVVPGQQVERGQNIGLVGETGEAYGAHLHFQVEVDGVAVNPLNYI